MPDWLDKVKGWINKITELGLGIVALGIVLGVIFGADVPFIGNIISNLTGLVNDLGGNGVVGVIALAIVAWLFAKRSPS